MEIEINYREWLSLSSSFDSAILLYQCFRWVVGSSLPFRRTWWRRQLDRELKTDIFFVVLIMGVKYEKFDLEKGWKWWKFFIQFSLTRKISIVDSFGIFCVAYMNFRTCDVQLKIEIACISNTSSLVNSVWFEILFDDKIGCLKIQIWQDFEFRVEDRANLESEISV